MRVAVPDFFFRIMIMTVIILMIMIIIGYFLVVFLEYHVAIPAFLFFIIMSAEIHDLTFNLKSDVKRGQCLHPIDDFLILEVSKKILTVDKRLRLE